MPGPHITDDGSGPGLYSDLASPSAVKSTVVLFGTSLEAQNGTGSDTLDPATAPGALSGRGWFNWANAFMGDAFRLVDNKGVSGNTSTQMLARVQADVVASSAEWVFMGAPVNDMSTGVISAATTIANLTAIYDAIRASGKRIVQLTAAPSTFYSTTAIRAAVSEVNRFIRELQFTRNDVIVVDAWRVLADLATGFPATGMAVDGVHYSEAGARRVGQEVATVLSRIVPPRPNTLYGLLDSRNVISNPHMAGGTGWATVTSSGTVTPVFSPATDRWGNKVAITISGATTAMADNGVQYIEPIGNGRYAAGDIIQMSARFKWSSMVPLGIAAPCTPVLRLWPRLADSSFPTLIGGQWIVTPSSDNQIQVGMPASGELVAVSTSITLPPTTANLYVMVAWRGAASGVVEVSDVAVYRV